MDRRRFLAAAATSGVVATSGCGAASDGEPTDRADETTAVPTDENSRTETRAARTVDRTRLARQGVPQQRQPRHVRPRDGELLEPDPRDRHLWLDDRHPPGEGR